ncbi:MAG: hypothetical protein AUI10_12445 [Actinobacteria bacterium 13_2_20CM_2_72_6]|nr:MAG: hypothetical protein AUI10_12445 [Actinobacteria bacterium 13_2_20CM_2_72_6]
MSGASANRAGQRQQVRVEEHHEPGDDRQHRQDRGQRDPGQRRRRRGYVALVVLVELFLGRERVDGLDHRLHRGAPPPLEPALRGRRTRKLVRGRLVVEVLGGRPGDRLGAGVEAGDDTREGLVEVGFRGSGGGRLVGQLGEVAPGRVDVLAVDEQPVGRSGRQRGCPGDGMQVGGGLQVGGDAPDGEDVEQVLAHPGIDVSGRRVRGRDEPVVPPSPTGTARGHRWPPRVAPRPDRRSLG